MTWNIPNSLTILRILAIPLVIIVFYTAGKHAGIYSSIIFALAGFTDWFDGYLARRLGQTSRFGAFLDPVADKLMVAVILILLVDHYGQPWSLLITLSAMVIIGREITISALREWMAEVGERGKIAVSWLGKVKTTLQMFALFFLLYQEPLFGIPVAWLGFILLVIAAVLTLWSMLNYLRAAFSESNTE